MKLFLFGGGESIDNRTQILKQLIKEALLSSNPKSILHIPFARISSHEEEWQEGWFKKLMEDTGIQIHDARIQEEIDSFKGNVIFINGGHERYDLLMAIKNNTKLLNLVLNAEIVVAESAGSRILGEKLRKYKAGEGDDIIDGIGLLKGVIIEPHYTEKHAESLLLEELKNSKMKYGLGIDTTTRIEINPQEFPINFKKSGIGNIFIIENPEVSVKRVETDVR